VYGGEGDWSSRRSGTAVLREPSRLAAVQRTRLLLAASHLPLDRLVRLTAQAAGAPLCAVTVLDADRSEVAAAVGYDPARAPFEPVVCREVVNGGVPLILDNTRRTGISAVVSFPIHFRDAAVGTICVGDRHPRPWTPAQVDAVGDAALMITALLASAADAEEAIAAAIDSAVAGCDATLDAMGEVHLPLAPDGTIIRWSAGAEATFGWSATEAVGRDAGALLVAPRSRAEYGLALAKATRPDHPVPQRLPLLVVYRDGHEFSMDAAIAAVPDGPPGRRRAFLALHDVNERAATEHEAVQQRALLTALLDSLQTRVIACDAEGRLLLFNSDLRHEWGDRETAPSAEWTVRYDVRHVDGRKLAPAELPLIRALAGEDIVGERIILRAPESGDHLTAVSGRQLRSPDGEVLGAFVILHEETELVQANRLKECEVKVSRLLQHDVPFPEAARGVLAAVVETLDRPYAELWTTVDGQPELRLAATARGRGREFADFAPRRLDRAVGPAGAAWQQGVPVWVSDLRADPDPAVAAAVRNGLLSAVAVPIRRDERVIGVLALYADTVQEPAAMLEASLSGVAAHVGLYLERRRAAALATELAHAKDAYIGLVGHELRTPLTSISAYTDLLMEDPELRDDHRTMLTVVQRNSAVLRALITDLLDLVAFDSGQATLKLHPTELADTVGGALAAIAPTAANAGVKVDADVVAPCVVAGDAPRLRQVVDNLLANALRYTPEGGTIAVRLRRADDAAVLSISDTGVSVPAEDRPHLFDRFFRSSAITSGGRSGNGLGLTIARTIVSAHGGTLSVVDVDGPGTTFVLRLPAGTDG
jgi:PAS domain S-box-containing protein